MNEQERYQERLVRLALEMVALVRDVEPRRNWMWWQSLSDRERIDLPWVLAAMVDPDATTKELLGWTWQFAPREAA